MKAKTAEPSFKPRVPSFISTWESNFFDCDSGYPVEMFALCSIQHLLMQCSHSLFPHLELLDDALDSYVMIHIDFLGGEVDNKNVKTVISKMGIELSDSELSKLMENLPFDGISNPDVILEHFWAF